LRLNQKLKLYINGVLDSAINTAGTTVNNNYPLYLGNTPWTQSSCSVPLFMDNVRFYTRELSVNEISAEASAAWGSV